jgi:hypothetical protein
MPNLIKTTVIKDTATPALQAMIRSVSPARPMLAALSERLLGELKEHFRLKEAQPNKSGWPKGHFWGRVRQLTVLGPVSDTEGSVIIGDSRFAIRYYGGTILPKEKANLAIPINPQAAGIYPMQNKFPGLFLTFRRVDGELKKFLATGDKSDPKSQMFLYVLKKSVEHPKDPTALPPDEKINAVLMDEAGKFIELAQRRAGA